MSDTPKKPLPRLKTDAEAENFIAHSDLTEYDLSSFKPLSFEFENKTARVNMRFPASQLELIKHEAEKRHIPYQRFMRELVERGMKSLDML